MVGVRVYCIVLAPWKSTRYLKLVYSALPPTPCKLATPLPPPFLLPDPYNLTIPLHPSFYLLQPCNPHPPFLLPPYKSYNPPTPYLLPPTILQPPLKSYNPRPPYLDPTTYNRATHLQPSLLPPTILQPPSAFAPTPYSLQSCNPPSSSLQTPSFLPLKHCHLLFTFPTTPKILKSPSTMPPLNPPVFAPNTIPPLYIPTFAP